MSEEMGSANTFPRLIKKSPAQNPVNDCSQHEWRSCSYVCSGSTSPHHIPDWAPCYCASLEVSPDRNLTESTFS